MLSNKILLVATDFFINLTDTNQWTCENMDIFMNNYLI